MNVRTVDLRPGDVLTSPGDPTGMTDTVQSVELPDPPGVIAKIHVVRHIRGKVCRTYILSGVGATHTDVVR